MLAGTKFNFLFNLLILFLIKLVLSEETVEVKLKQGALLGKVEKSFLKQQNYFSFKGVPFAEPPVDKLRFLPPEPHQGWDGAYEAFTNKPTCLQFNGRMRNDEPFGASGSEDCLYVSVFTPDMEGNAPVVVFDYNDNFRLGFNGTDTYSPEFFVEEGVVVVTISHRLGVFGYLTTEDDVIPANAGIKDFILGLKWVQENIKQFGGDPTRVTLMGNRGGAALAHILMYSDKATGLFSAVIMQSGTALEAIYFFNNPSTTAYKMAEVVDVKAEDSKTLLEELQKVDAQKIISKEIMVVDNEMLKKNQMSIYPFSPTIESNHPDSVIKFLPEKGKIINDVPVLMGFNSRDGLDLVSIFIFEPRMLKDSGFQSTFHFPIRTNFRFDRNSTMFEEVIHEVHDYYLEDGYLNTHNILEYAVCAGDQLQNYAIYVTAKKLAAELESPVFYYMFDFRGSLNENSENMMKKARFSMKNWGATITDELCYLHLCARIRKNYEKLAKLVSEQPEVKILRKMVRMWTNFAKTRNPTPENDDIIKDVVWTPVIKVSKKINYLHITRTLKMKTDPLGERAGFWERLLERYSKMAVDGVVGDKPEENEDARDEL